MYWTYRQRCARRVVLPAHDSNARATIRPVSWPVSASAIRSIDPSAAIARRTAHAGRHRREVWAGRDSISVCSARSPAVAILLAVAGLYGVLSYAVAQRTRELGIRAALGSPRQAIMRLVTIDGLTLVAIGLRVRPCGRGGASPASWSFMLYGVSPLDPLTWAAARCCS